MEKLPTTEIGLPDIMTESIQPTIHTLELMPDLRLLPEARRLIANAAEEAGFAQERIFDIKVASSEAMANAIEHEAGGGAILVESRLFPDRLEIFVRGTGEFEMPARSEKRQHRGLGLPLMASFSDRLAFCSAPRGGGTLLTLTFYREGQHRPDVESPPSPEPHDETHADINVDLKTRQETEEALRKSEEKFSKAFYGSPTLMFISELETGIFVEVNDAYCEVTGYCPEELIGHSSLERGIVTAESRREMVAALTREGRPPNVEMTIKAKDGSSRICLVSLQTIDYTGIPCLICSGVDITERKRAEEATARALADLAVLARLDEIFLHIRGEELYPAVLEVVKEVSSSPHGLVAFLDDDGAAVAPLVRRRAHDGSKVELQRLRLSKELWGNLFWSRAMQKRRTVVVNEPVEVPLEPRAAGRAMAVPILFKGRAIGHFLVSDKLTDYSDQEVAILERMARHIAPALHARLESERHYHALVDREALYRELAGENERLYRQQLDIAESLQLALLNIPSELGPLKLGHLYRSATEAARVGGDFYDVFDVKDGKLALLIGDVSGHGIQAARTATLVKDVVHAFTHQSQRTQEVLRRTNGLLVEKDLPGFVTLFLGILDTATGLLRYSSAGHPEMLVRHGADEIRGLGAASTPLGVKPDASWRASEVQLEAGDLLLLYTDGVLEARRNGEFFGEKRLQRLLKRKRISVERLPHLILDQVLAFSGGSLKDDVALVALSLTKLEKPPRTGGRYGQESLLE